MRLARIPLIFISKDQDALSSIQSGAYASQLDFAPTLLHLTGITAPPYFMGQSLLINNTENLAIGRHGKTFFIHSPDGSRLIDLSQGTTNVSAVNKWMSNYQSAAYQYENTDGIKITGQ
jgi:arylsulfatase A-like enzyme